MGSVIICKYIMAKKPYVIEKENLKLYSTEELCFYLTHHIYEIDNTIINGKLASWLNDEVRATRVAGILNQQIAARTPILKMLETILTECDYLPKEDIQKIIYKQALPITPSQEAENLGNLFLQQEKFEKAVKAYRKTLRYRKQEREDQVGAAEIYEKIGIAYGRMFLYDEAAESFALSYLMNPVQKTLEMYYATIEMGGQEVEEMSETGFDSVKEFYNQTKSLEQKIVDNTYKELAARVSDIHDLKLNEKEREYEQALDKLVNELKENAKGQLT